MRSPGGGAAIPPADLLGAYPRLTREDIQAALGSAAGAVEHEETLILPAAGSSQSA